MIISIGSYFETKHKKTDTKNALTRKKIFKRNNKFETNRQNFLIVCTCLGPFEGAEFCFSFFERWGGETRSRNRRSRRPSPRPTTRGGSETLRRVHHRLKYFKILFTLKCIVSAPITYVRSNITKNLDIVKIQK